MTQEMNTQLADKTFYTSATKKIHSTECRHCRPDNKGWQKIDSLLSAIDEGYQLCRTCCPSEDEIRSLSLQSNSLPVTEIKTEDKSTEDNTEIVNQNDNKTESSEDKNDTTSAEEVVVAEKTEDKTTKEEKIQTEVADSNTIAETSKTEEVSKAKTSEQATETKSDIDSPATSETAKTEEVSEAKISEEASENKSDSETQSEGETKSKKKRKRKKKKKQVEGEAESESAEKEPEPEPEPPKEKKFFKVLAGNGCHQAIAEVQGILIPPLETNGKFTLVLSDGMQLEVLFRNPRLKWLVNNQSGMIGMHWFRGYPKMQNDKLIGLQVIAWDGNMIENKQESESWDFIGVWTLQKNLTVQRSILNQEVLTIAEETGFVKKFKYSFSNAYEWMKSKKLWVGYVYKLICQREGDKFKIMKVIPYACPRKKPVPKDNKPPFNKGKGKFNPENKGDKKQDKNQDNTSKKQTNEIANDNKGKENKTKENKTKENKVKAESSKNE